MVTNNKRRTNNRVNLEQVRSWTMNRADFCKNCMTPLYALLLEWADCCNIGSSGNKSKTCKRAKAKRDERREMWKLDLYKMHEIEEKHLNMRLSLTICQTQYERLSNTQSELPKSGSNRSDLQASRAKGGLPKKTVFLGIFPKMGEGSPQFPKLL